MQLKNQRIIVTGGARGIGATALSAFVAEGAKVASLDILDDIGNEVAAQANEQGSGSAFYLNCDIAKRQSVKQAFERAVETLGGLDALVNCAGIEGHVAADTLDDAVWDRMMDVNVKGTFLTNQAAFGYLKKSGGAILNFGSDAGLLPYPTAAHYSASKGAVMAWTRSVASAWGPFNIRVNSVVPAMWTPMYDEHRATMAVDELVTHDAAMAAMVSIGGKLGDPTKDLAPVLVFLLTDGARFMTGQLIPVNGGMNMLCG